jgi:hypothetical protein
MFDISTLALKADHELHLKHPLTETKLFADAEEKKPVMILLHGTASKQYRNQVQAMQTRQLRRNAKKEKPSAETMNEEAVELLVACSAGTKNFVFEGTEFSGTPEAFRKLYSDPKFSWLRAQVDEAIGDVGNFLKE